MSLFVLGNTSFSWDMGAGGAVGWPGGAGHKGTCWFRDNPSLQLESERTTVLPTTSCLLFRYL